MLTKLSKPLLQLPRWQKRLVMLALDCVLLPFAIWAAFALRHSTWTPDLNDGVWLLFLAPFFAIPIFVQLGLYRAVIRYITGQAMLAVMQALKLAAHHVATATN